MKKKLPSHDIEVRVNALSPNFLRRSRSTISFSSVVRVVGMMCLMESALLLICTIVALGYQESDILPFTSAFLVSIATGSILLLVTKGKVNKQTQGYREGALSVALTWIVLSLIGTLPFLVGGYLTNFADAFFETMSAFTTTGSTTFADVESLPHGILFWRSIMQWTGGIGIVVFTMALIPLFSSGKNGGSLYNAETSGITHERFLPRIRVVVQKLWIVYVSITVILIILLLFGGMNLFDAICHAFTCIPTGGLSTKNNSIAFYHSRYIEYIIVLFMIIGSTNLSLLYISIFKKPKDFFKDEEFRWFIILIATYTLITFIGVFSSHHYASIEESFRKSLFQVVTLISSTGYLTENYNLWGPFFACLSIPIMTVCGCAGSTSGGLKISRIMVMLKNLKNEFRKRIHGNMVLNVRLNRRSINGDVIMQVLAFVSLYILIIILGTIALSFMGYQPIDSISMTISSISNCGPCSGVYISNFAEAGMIEKILLSFIMLAGRLEVFTFVGIIMPSFYKR